MGDDDDDWVHCAEARRVFRLRPAKVANTKQAARSSSMPSTLKKITKPATKKTPTTKNITKPTATPITKQLAKPSGKKLPSAPSSSSNSKSLRIGTWCSGMECLGQALRSCGVDFVHAYACDTLRTAQASAYSLPIADRLLLHRETNTTQYSVAIAVKVVVVVCFHHHHRHHQGPPPSPPMTISTRNPSRYHPWVIATGV